MSNVYDMPMLNEVRKITANMYRQGWNERNGGNISCMIDKEDEDKYLSGLSVIRTTELTAAVPELDGKCFLVTGTGKYFKNIEDDPETNLGIVRLREGGKKVDLLWGFKDGGRYTSEFASHLMAHSARFKQDKQHRIIMHAHPLNVLSMTHLHDLDDRAFTKTIWQMCTECLVVFPDGIGVLPWMVCGNDEIGRATAKKFEEYRICIWAAHGIMCSGKDIDETFGLMETVEKAAQIYMQIAGHKRTMQVSDDDLKRLAAEFSLKVKDGWLD